MRGSIAKNAEPVRPVGIWLVQTQSRGVKSGVDPVWVDVTVPLGSLSKYAKKMFTCRGSEVVAVGQRFGGFLASSGWKLHCVGGVRSSTASAAVATWSQSLDVRISPDGSPVTRSGRSMPIRSEQDCSIESAWSGKSLVSCWYTDIARK